MEVNTRQMSPEQMAIEDAMDAAQRAEDRRMLKDDALPIDDTSGYGPSEAWWEMSRPKQIESLKRALKRLNPGTYGLHEPLIRAASVLLKELELYEESEQRFDHIATLAFALQESFDRYFVDLLDQIGYVNADFTEDEEEEEGTS